MERQHSFEIRPRRGLHDSKREEEEVANPEEEEDSEEELLDASLGENYVDEDSDTDREENEDEVDDKSANVVHSRRSEPKTLRESVKIPQEGSNWPLLWILLVLSAITIPVLSAISGILQNDGQTLEMNTIKAEFPTQDNFLWLAFESGVQDVVQRNKPATFILLYKPEAEKTVSELLEQLSKYAACNIIDCSQHPIVLNYTELNSPAVVKDYGIIIEKYENALKQKGVMIVNNLEKVKGTSAQVFHAFCDEFTPLVQRSVLIFTMNVKEIPVNQMKFVVDFFRDKWSDIKADTFNALITRMTNMVLEVKA